MSTPWPVIENMVLSRIAALKASDEVEGETNYLAIPKTNTQMEDAAFNRSAVRDMILDVTIEVVGFICKNEGDPRRINFAVLILLSNGATVPSSMGPYGNIADNLTGRALVRRSVAEVTERVANPGSLWSEPVYFFAIDGITIYHTVALANLEYFNYPRPATDYTNLTNLFSSMANFYPLGDEFAVVVADGAAGRLCMKAGSMVAEGARFLDAYYTGLKERGVSIQPVDFPAMPSN